MYSEHLPDEKLIHSEQGKLWELPRLVAFEGMGIGELYTYKVLGYRTLEKGEFYLSGCKGFIEAYKSAGSSCRRLVVKPLRRVEKRTVYVECD